MANILLASVNCFSELVNGKVVVINPNGTYTTYRPSRFCTIADNFNPMDYSILIHDKYSPCIVYSTLGEREHFLVNKLFIETYHRPVPTYRVGDRIHLHSRRGIYELVDIQPDRLKITCKKWSYDSDPYHYIAKQDFKCLAGGLYNQVFE